MSGGSLEYASSKVNNIINKLGEVMDEIEKKHSPEYAALDKLLQNLEYCSRGLLDAELWLSADTDSKDLLKWANEVRNG
jgi:hypothetical protein